MITTFLTVPDASAGRAAFVAAANAFGNGLTPVSNEMNATAADVNADAADAAASASASATAKAAAEAARDAAQAAALALADNWAPATAYAVNDLAWNGAGALYRCITAHTSGATFDGANWAQVSLSPADIAALSAAVDALRDVPPVAVSAARALALTDRGRNLSIAANLTIPASASVPFAEGAVVVVTNRTGGSLSLTPAAGVTLRLAGTTKTGALTLAPTAKVSLSCEGADLWYAVGVGAA